MLGVYIYNWGRKPPVRWSNFKIWLPYIYKHLKVIYHPSTPAWTRCATKMVEKFDLPINSTELSLDLLALLSDGATPRLPWLMPLKWDDMPTICFHALPSCKTFSIPFPGALRMKYNYPGSNEFLLEERIDEDNYDDECATSIFHLKLDRLGRNMRDRELLPLPPVVNWPKFLNFRPEESKRPAMIVPSMRYLAHHEQIIFTYETAYGIMPKHIVVIDDGTKEIVSTVPCPKEHLANCYLISTRDGLLMIVKKSAPPQDDVPYDNCQFVIYRLENYDPEPHWTRLSEIGDIMLFLDEYNGFSLSANNDEKFRGNCIYFITNLKWNPRSPLTHYVLAGFDMAKNKSFEVCSLGESSPYDTFPFWIIPTLY